MEFDTCLEAFEQEMDGFSVETQVLEDENCSQAEALREYQEGAMEAASQCDQDEEEPTPARSAIAIEPRMLTNSADSDTCSACNKRKLF